ncbi:MAG: hypothetical protein ACPGVF_06385, partial [Flavobacteriaceae bacterium]
MKMLRFSIIIILMFWNFLVAQEKEQENKSPLETALNGFTFRSLGPAFMSGRIADIAIDPHNENVW